MLLYKEYHGRGQLHIKINENEFLPTRATNSTRPCSYVALSQGEIAAIGLPDGIELKKPSSYGINILRKIIAAKNAIQFNGMYDFLLQILLQHSTIYLARNAYTCRIVEMNCSDVCQCTYICKCFFSSISMLLIHAPVSICCRS